MKFSMNGFRKQLHNDTKALKKICESILAGEPYESDDLEEAVNVLITHSNVINCVFNPNDPDFTEIDLELEHVVIKPEVDKRTDVRTRQIDMGGTLNSSKPGGGK